MWTSVKWAYDIYIILRTGRTTNLFFISAQRVDVMLCSCRMARTLLFSNGHSIGKISQLPRRHCYTLFGSRKVILFDFNFEIYPSFSSVRAERSSSSVMWRETFAFDTFEWLVIFLFYAPIHFRTDSEKWKTQAESESVKPFCFFSDYWTVPIGVRMEIISIVGSFWSDFGV